MTADELYAMQLHNAINSDNVPGVLPSQQEQPMVEDDRKPAAREIIDLSSDNGSTRRHTPPPPQIVHRRAIPTTVTASSLSSHSGDQISSSFDSTAARKARDERIINNGMATFDAVVKYNNKKLHNNKNPSDLTTPQKQERSKAKKRKVMLKDIKKKGEQVEVIQECIGTDDKNLSEAKLDVGEEILLARIERAVDTDDSDDSD